MLGVLGGEVVALALALLFKSNFLPLFRGGCCFFESSIDCSGVNDKSFDCEVSCSGTLIGTELVAAEEKNE